MIVSLTVDCSEELNDAIHRAVRDDALRNDQPLMTVEEAKLAAEKWIRNGRFLTVNINLLSGTCDVQSHDPNIPF